MVLTEACQDHAGVHISENRFFIMKIISEVQYKNNSSVRAEAVHLRVIARVKHVFEQNIPKKTETLTRNKYFVLLSSNII